VKIQVDGQDILTVTDHHKEVLKDGIFRDKLDLALKTAMFELINHKYNRCFERLKKEWVPKLAARGVTSIPTDKDAFAQLVFSQKDYKDRSAREAEAGLV